MRVDCIFCSYASSGVDDLKAHSANCGLHPLTAERDQLRAEVDRLRGKLENAELNWRLTQDRATKWAQESTAAEAHAADLRAALEEIQEEVKAFDHDGQEYEDECNACTSDDCQRCAIWHGAENVLAGTPAQSLVRIQAAAIRGAAALLMRERMPNEQYGHAKAAVALDCEALEAEANRLEGAGDNSEAPEAATV